MSPSAGAGRAAAAGLVALLLVLTGCGGDPTEDYCDAVSAEQETFAAMQEDDTGLGLLRQREMLRSLAEQAPDDLRDEWQTLLGGLDAFAATLDDVGVAPEDFVDGRPPASLPDADRDRIAKAASELSSPDVVSAANGIEQQARDVCKLQLGL